MGETTLVNAQTLARRLGDPELRILDCRFELGDADAGAAAYAAGHLPGAQYVHLDRDLSGPRTPWSGATRYRNRRYSQQASAPSHRRHDRCDCLRRCGGMYAARAWWLLRWLGHERVAVLDGGLAAWRAARLPLTTAASVVAARSFVGHPAASACVSADEVAALLGREACLLVDARAAERYRGESSRSIRARATFPARATTPTS